VDALSIAEGFLFPPLLGCHVQEAREPCERSADLPPISQVHHQFVLGDLHVLGQRVWFSGQRTHATDGLSRELEQDAERVSVVEVDTRCPPAVS
jgi:hypothetical protein